MKRVSLMILAVVAVTVVTACGAAHRRVVIYGGSATITEPNRGYVGFHSPNHHYSTGQVEAAFASHGIRLRRWLSPPGFPQVRGVVLLRSGRRPHLITVVVRTGHPSALITLQVNPGLPHPTLTHRANIYAYSDRGDTAAVKSALAKLH